MRCHITQHFLIVGHAAYGHPFVAHLQETAVIHGSVFAGGDFPGSGVEIITPHFVTRLRRFLVVTYAVVVVGVIRAANK